MNKWIILVEAGPGATLQYYNEVMDYHFNPIDTIFLAVYIGSINPEALGPEFPDLKALTPYYDVKYTSALQ